MGGPFTESLEVDFPWNRFSRLLVPKINSIASVFPFLRLMIHSFVVTKPAREIIQVLGEIYYIKHETQCFITYQTPRGELKIRLGAEYFWRTSRFLILWWNTVTSVWYNFSNKLIWKEKLRMQKRGVFHQISKHVTVRDFLCLWLLND